MVQLFSKRQVIERIDGVKEANGPRSLVPLQMADQVPGGRQAFDDRRLRLPFLDPIFAEMTDARFEGFADPFCRERLGYAHDGYIGSFAPRASGGPLYALLKGGDIFCHNALRSSHSADFSRVGRPPAKC